MTEQEMKSILGDISQKIASARFLVAFASEKVTRQELLVRLSEIRIIADAALGRL